MDDLGHERSRYASVAKKRYGGNDRERPSRRGARAQDKFQDPLAGESPELGLVRLLHRTVATLNPAVATTLLEHPDALRSALAVAAQTLLKEPPPEELTESRASLRVY